MKPRINELKVEYIECAGCSYQKSCLVPDSQKAGKFSWHCPRCGRLWMGTREREGSLSVEEVTRQKESRFVLIEMAADLIPVLLSAVKSDASETESEATMVKGSAKFKRAHPESLLLIEAAEPDAENNPRGLVRYLTSKF